MLSHKVAQVIQVHASTIGKVYSILILSYAMRNQQLIIIQVSWSLTLLHVYKVYQKGSIRYYVHLIEIQYTYTMV